MQRELICGICGRKLESECVSLAEDRKYHLECFLCAVCNKKLGGSSFFEVEHKLYCEDDYHPRFSPACVRCDKIIKNEYVEIDGQNYHSTCFTCYDCNSSFKGLQYYKYGGSPYCNDCFKKRALTCAKCNTEIAIKAHSALNKTFHPECFACYLCNKAFIDGKFITNNDKAFHPDCYKLKFTTFCFICKNEIWGEYLYVEGAGLHQECYPKFRGLNPVDQKRLISQARSESFSRVNNSLLSTAPQVNDDPKEPEIPIRRTTIQPEQKIIEGISTNEKGLSPSGTVYEYEALMRPPYPKGMDPSRREQYLSYEEFERIFKMRYEEFVNLKSWKQADLKKNVKLF